MSERVDEAEGKLQDALMDWRRGQLYTPALMAALREYVDARVEQALEEKKL